MCFFKILTSILFLANSIIAANWKLEDIAKIGVIRVQEESNSVDIGSDKLISIATDVQNGALFGVAIAKSVLPNGFNGQDYRSSFCIHNGSKFLPVAKVSRVLIVKSEAEINHLDENALTLVFSTLTTIQKVVGIFANAHTPDIHSGNRLEAHCILVDLDTANLDKIIDSETLCVRSLNNVICTIFEGIAPTPVADPSTGDYKAVSQQQHLLDARTHFIFTPQGDAILAATLRRNFSAGELASSTTSTSGPLRRNSDSNLI